MTKDKADAIMVLVFVVGPFAAAAVYVALVFALDFKRRRVERYLEHERSRLAQGLPAHERCGCDDCAAWRRRVSP